MTGGLLILWLNTGPQLPKGPSKKRLTFRGFGPKVDQKEETKGQKVGFEKQGQLCLVTRPLYRLSTFALLPIRNSQLKSVRQTLASGHV